MLRLILITSVITVANCDRLFSAVVIHRHGDRNPFTSYKTDPYKDESHWPEGLGQLTKRGIQRQYELGNWLKQRYHSLLLPRYSPKNIRVVSTDVDRTLMSAEVTLAGLYPPSEFEKFDEKLNWQPIPIHTAPPKDDPVLAMKKSCKKYEQLFNDLLHSHPIQEINEINKNLYDFLSEKTGEEINDVYDVEIIHNALHTQFLANKTLPEWALEVYPEQMKPAVLLRYKLPCYKKELARLRTGLLLGEILKNFQGCVKNEGYTKLLLYSGHDSTLADILTTIGAFNDEVPPYSSAVLIELHEKDDEYVVNVFLRNSTGIFDLVVQTCDFDCNWGNFTRILEPLSQSSAEEWERECEN